MCVRYSFIRWFFFFFFCAHKSRPHTEHAQQQRIVKLPPLPLLLLLLCIICYCCARCLVQSSLLDSHFQHCRCHCHRHRCCSESNKRNGTTKPLTNRLEINRLLLPFLLLYSALLPIGKKNKETNSTGYGHFISFFLNNFQI